MPRDYTTVVIPRRPLEVRVPTPGHGVYLDSGELMDIARQSGSHFFDPDTMRAFRSKLYDIYPAADGWVFVTSEKHVSHTSYGSINEPRLFTVRKLVIKADAIEIDELSEFQEYKTLEAARKRAGREAAASFAAVGVHA